MSEREPDARTLPGGRVTAVIAAVGCALVAVALADRRDDERTLRAANVAGGEGRLHHANTLAARLTDGTTAAEAWTIRATVAARELRFQDARVALGRALERRPNDWLVRRDLAAVLLALGRQDDARREYARALALNPQMPPLPAFGFDDP